MADNKKECNMNVAIGKGLTVSNALKNSSMFLQSINEITPSRLIMDTAETLSEQALHRDNQGAKTMYTDSKEFMKYAEKYCLNENGHIERFISSIFVRPADMMKNTPLEGLSEEIIQAHDEAMNNYSKYLDELYLQDEIDVKQIKSFESFFAKEIGWDNIKREFKQTSDYFEYNELLERVKNDERISNQYNYFVRWINHVTENQVKQYIDNIISQGTKNIKTSLLRNNISSAIVNATQMPSIISPELGLSAEDQITTYKYWFKGVATALNLPLPKFSEEEMEELRSEGIAVQNVFLTNEDRIDLLMEKVGKKIEKEKKTKYKDVWTNKGVGVLTKSAQTADKAVVDLFHYIGKPIDLLADTIPVKVNPFYTARGLYRYLQSNDVFQKMELPNQGTAYFTAKEIAKRENPEWTEEQIRDYAKKFNEKVNFVSRGCNQPEAFWSLQGNTLMALATYTTQSAKLQADHMQCLNPMVNISIDERKKLASKLTASAVSNFVFLGAFSLPTYLLSAFLFKLFPDWDKEYKKLKSENTFFRSGLVGYLGINTSGNVKVQVPELIALIQNFQTNLVDGLKEVAEDIDKISKGKEPNYNKMAKHFGKFLNAFLAMHGYTAKRYGIGQAEISKIADLIRRWSYKDFDRQVYETKAKYSTTLRDELARIVLPKTDHEAMLIEKANLHQIEAREEKQEKTAIKKAFLDDRMDDYYDLAQQYADKYGKDFDEVTKNIEKGIKSSKTRRIKDLENNEELTEEEYELKHDKIVTEMFNDDEEAYEDYASEKDIETGYKPSEEEDEEEE